MKNKLKLMLLLLGILFATNSLASEKGRHRYKDIEEFQERFQVSANSRLDINTRYGSVVIVEGKQNEITVDVTIELSANKERDLDELREGINVDIYKSGNTVSVKTDVDLHNLGGVSFTIDYYITVPKDYIPTIINKYGSVNLNSDATNATIDVKYGSFTANMLKGTSNLTIKYSSSRIEKADIIKIGMGYGNSRITEANSIDIGEYKYGNLYVQNANSIQIEEFKYGNITVDKLNESFVCNEIKYSKLNIKECSNNLKKITAHGSYTPIRVTLPGTLAFKSNLKTRYGNINNQHSDRMTITELEAGGSSVREAATTKNQTSNPANIYITTTYANISIYN